MKLNAEQIERLQSAWSEIDSSLLAAKKDGIHDSGLVYLWELHDILMEANAAEHLSEPQGTAA